MKKSFQVRNIIKIIFLIFFINNANSYLVFPLEYLPNENYKFTKNKTLQPEEMMKVLFYRNIITKFELGTPPQNISLFIKLNDDKFYISSSLPSKLSEKKETESDLYKFDKNDLYNESLSSSFNEGICKSKVHEVYHYSEICLSKEKMNFNFEKKTYQKEFPIKVVKNNDGNIPGTLGLLLNDTYYGVHKSFINDLKDEKLIDNYYWFFDFDGISPLEKKMKGKFIVGGLPHEIFPEKFSLENYKVTHPYIAPSAFKSWKLRFDNIILTGDKNYTSLKTITSFTYQIYHIIGTREFYYRIKSLFLNKLFKEQKCFESNFTQNFYLPNKLIFFYCDKLVKDTLYSNLNSIKFVSMDLDYAFEMTYEDLFYTKDDYIYLNVIFSTKEYGFWILGQMFLAKYKFVFNPDKKEIGFYNINNLNKDKDKDKKNLSYNKSNKIMSVFFIVLLSICFTCIGLLIGRKIYGMRRKVIVNELIEEQNYEYRENEKIGSNDIKSNYKQIGNNNYIFEMSQKFSDYS